VCDIEYILSDAISPIISNIPADISVECLDLVPGIQSVSVTDNCDTQIELVFSQDTIITCDGDGYVVNYWSAIDCSGNFSSGSQSVTILDVTNPTIMCPPDLTLDTDIDECERDNVILGSLIFSDNCSIDTFYNDLLLPLNLGVHQVSWTVSDCSLNSNSCIQTITIVDNQIPNIICPIDLTVNTTLGLCNRTGLRIGSASSGDNCGIIYGGNNRPSIYYVGNTIVTHIVEDIAGNTATCDQNITVEDNEDPVITCPSDITVNTDTGSCQSTMSLSNGSGSDNCGIQNLSHNGSGAYSLGTTVVKHTAEDNSGNTATCDQNITVEDNEDPTITCPSDLTVDTDMGSCEATGVSLGNELSDDNCSVAVTNNSSEPYTLGTTSVVYTVTDGSGNSTTCEQSVTVEDNEAPIITCPADMTVNTDLGNCEATGVVLGIATSTDNCTVMSVINNGMEPYFIGITTVTHIAEDENSNTAACDQIITVEENEDPSITCPVDITVNTDSGSCEAVLSLSSATGSDNCGITIFSHNGSGVYSLGITIVTHTAEDLSGNTSTCEQTITVEDNETPTITCPSDLTVDTDLGSCEATGVSLGIEVSDDNCSVVVSNDATEPYSLGTTSIIYTATDGSGNTTTCEQIITVEDNEEPAITCPVNLTVNADLGNCQSTGIVL